MICLSARSFITKRLFFAVSISLASSAVAVYPWQCMGKRILRPIGLVMRPLGSALTCNRLTQFMSNRIYPATTKILVSLSRGVSRNTTRFVGSKIGKGAGILAGITAVGACAIWLYRYVRTNRRMQQNLGQQNQNLAHDLQAANQFIQMLGARGGLQGERGTWSDQVAQLRQDADVLPGARQRNDELDALVRLRDDRVQIFMFEARRLKDEITRLEGERDALRQEAQASTERLMVLEREKSETMKNLSEEDMRMQGIIDGLIGDIEGVRGRAQLTGDIVTWPDQVNALRQVAQERSQFASRIDELNGEIARLQEQVVVANSRLEAAVAQLRVDQGFQQVETAAETMQVADAAMEEPAAACAQPVLFNVPPVAPVARGKINQEGQIIERERQLRDLLEQAEPREQKIAEALFVRVDEKIAPGIAAIRMKELLLACANQVKDWADISLRVPYRNRLERLSPAFIQYLAGQQQTGEVRDRLLFWLESDISNASVQGSQFEALYQSHMQTKMRAQEDAEHAAAAVLHRGVNMQASLLQSVNMNADSYLGQPGTAPCAPGPLTLEERNAALRAQFNKTHTPAAVPTGLTLGMSRMIQQAQGQEVAASTLQPGSDPQDLSGSWAVFSD